MSEFVSRVLFPKKLKQAWPHGNAIIVERHVTETGYVSFVIETDFGNIMQLSDEDMLDAYEIGYECEYIRWKEDKLKNILQSIGDKGTGQYNHMVTVAFEVRSNHQGGDDLAPFMLRSALLQRILNLDQDEAWIEACLPIHDTFEEEKPNE